MIFHDMCEVQSNIFDENDSQRAIRYLTCFNEICYCNSE